MYIEDALGDRVWVDLESCKDLVANMCTLFATKPCSPLVSGGTGKGAGGGEQQGKSTPLVVTGGSGKGTGGGDQGSSKCGGGGEQGSSKGSGGEQGSIKGGGDGEQGSGKGSGGQLPVVSGSSKSGSGGKQGKSTTGGDGVELVDAGELTKEGFLSGIETAPRYTLYVV